MNSVNEYEIWLDTDTGKTHLLLVDFSYELVDVGIGWNEWCGAISFDSRIDPSVTIDSVVVVSESGTRNRTIVPTDKLKNKIIELIEDDYNFIEED